MKKIVAYAHNNLPSTTKHQLNKVYQVLPNGLKKILVRVLFRRSNVWPQSAVSAQLMVGPIYLKRRFIHLLCRIIQGTKN